MLLRLWWKDTRQFWPIWAFLTLAAIVTQLLMLHFGGPEVPRGILGVFALSWTGLYAFAVGAAAFAGERENGTLRFLDTLPASRGIVWIGKVSFAMVTTLVLALFLLLIAALGSEQCGMGVHRLAIVDAFPMVGLLSIALVLSLCCSSIMENALLAALASMGLTALSWVFLMARFDRFNGNGWAALRDSIIWLTISLLAALLASNIAFIWPRRTRRLRVPIRFQSPIVAEINPAHEVLTQLPVPSQVLPAANGPIPIPFVASTASARPWAVDQARPRSAWTEFRFLMWQTMREGRRIWSYLLAFGLIAPFAAALLGAGEIGLSPFALLSSLVGIMAGVSVFGLENQRRTYRFLVHHGARPTTIWLAKLTVWLIGLAILWSPLALLAMELATRQDIKGPAREEGVPILMTLPLIFAVALLCGMAIPRGITAGVIAIVVTIALGAAQYALFHGSMMPVWGFLVMPVALLVVTWAWSGDWLMDRPALGRYLRLALIVTGIFGVIFCGYTGERAWSIADPGPIAAPNSWVTAASLPPDRNAAELYREAGRKLGNPGDYRKAVGIRVIARENLETHRDRSHDALNLVRQAATLPDCQFHQPEGLTLLSRLETPPMDVFSKLLITQSRDHIKSGDLAGAWDDIMVLLRMARHLSEGAAMYPSLPAFGIEKDALALAHDWSIAPGQTPERLHAAMDAYRDLPQLIPASEVVRAETVLFERTINLPSEDLKGLLLEQLVGPQELAKSKIPIWAALYCDIITTPWERARAIRLNRQFADYLIRQASLEPSRQQLGPGLPVAYDLQTAPLLRYLQANAGACLNAENHNKVARRTLVLVMAIRSWQLRHDGQFPERLEDLVPSELPILPTDPYSGKPFRYIPCDPVNPSVDGIIFLTGKTGDPAQRPKESRLISSLDGGAFTIPPLTKPAAPKGQAGEPAKSKEPTKPAPVKPLPTPAVQDPGKGKAAAVKGRP